MMGPKNNDLSGASQRSVSVMNSEEGQETNHQKLVGRTITDEKIDRILTDVRAEIEIIRQNRISLGRVREQLAGIGAKWSGK